MFFTLGIAIGYSDSGGETVKVELCQSDLWQAFHRLGTEMIITKTGRYVIQHQQSDYVFYLTEMSRNLYWILTIKNIGLHQIFY